MNFLRFCSPAVPGRLRSGVLGLAVLLVLALALRFGLPEWRQWQARSLETQCRKLRDKRQWPQLGETAERWSKLDPNRANPWLFRAEAAAGQEQFIAAAEFLFQIPKSDPKAIPAHLKGATILLGPANRPLEGVEALQRLLLIEPRLADAHRHAIQFFALALQRRKLLRQVQFAIQSDREPPEAYVYLFLVDTLRLSNGVEMNTRWLQSYPNAEMFLVARALHMQEQRVKAENVDGGGSDQTPAPKGATSVRSQLLTDLLQRFPMNVELLSHHIEQSLLTGDVERAVRLVSEAPADIDEDNRFWRYKGQIHESRDETTEAEAAYRHALQINPLDWASMNRLAMTARLRGDFKEVERLQRLVKQAEKLREEVRNYRTAEEIGPEWLHGLKDFCRATGNTDLASAIMHRLDQVEKPPEKPPAKTP